MKSERILKFWKDIPKYTPMEEAEITESLSVVVTEDLVGDEIDVLIDVKNDYLGIKVNRKSSGETYKYWAKRFREVADIEHLRRFSPIPLGIIRLVGVEPEGWIKMLSLISCSAESGTSKFVNWEWMQEFSKVTQIGSLPEIYKGNARAEVIKKLLNVDKGFMGARRRGLFMITMNPVKYIRYAPNENKQHKPVKDLAVAHALAKEFSNIAVHEHMVMDAVKEKGVTSIDHMHTMAQIQAEEDGIIGDYKARLKQQAGLEAGDVVQLLDSYLMERTTELMNKYGLKVNR
jgi:hypothetical protein